MLWLLVVLLALMLLKIRNVYGALVVVGFGAAVGLASWYAPPVVLGWIAVGLAWLFLLAGPRPVVELLFRHAPGSDAAQLAGLTRVPKFVWNLAVAGADRGRAARRCAAPVPRLHPLALTRGSGLVQSLQQFHSRAAPVVSPLDGLDTAVHLDDAFADVHQCHLSVPLHAAVRALEVGVREDLGGPHRRRRPGCSRRGSRPVQRWRETRLTNTSSMVGSTSSTWASAKPAPASRSRRLRAAERRVGRHHGVQGRPGQVGLVDARCRLQPLQGGVDA